MIAYAGIFRRLLLASAFAFVAQAVTAETTADLAAAWQEYQQARSAGDPGAVVSAAERVLEIGRVVLPAGDERLPVLMLNYGKALSAAGQPLDAREAIDAAIDSAADLLGPDAVVLAEYWLALAEVEGELGSRDYQRRAYRKALDRVGEHYGDDSEAYADIALDAGTTMFAAGEIDYSVKLIRDAHAAYSSSLGPTHDKTAMATLVLGRVEFQRGDYGAAERLMLDGLPALQTGKPEHVESEMRIRAFLVELLERQDRSSEATEHCLAIGRLSEGREQQEYLPLYRETPVYPMDMLSAGIVGHVDLEFTVDEAGFVREPVVVATEQRQRDSAGRRNLKAAQRAAAAKSFEKEALAAVSEFRYAPTVVDGEATPTPGVRTRITFRIVSDPTTLLPTVRKIPAPAEP
jgi:tetratricopeptide (TPR) repeat protein